MRHGPGDPSHPDQTQRLAVTFVPIMWVGRQPLHSRLRTCRSTFAGAARRHQQQGHGDIRGAVCQHFRRIGDYQPARPGGVEIDVVEAHAVAADNSGLEVLHGEDLCIDLIGDGGAKGIGALQRLMHLADGHGDILFVQLHVEDFPHPVLDLFRPFTADYYFRFTHLIFLNSIRDPADQTIAAGDHYKVSLRDSVSHWIPACAGMA